MRSDVTFYVSGDRTRVDQTVKSSDLKKSLNSEKELDTFQKQMLKYKELSVWIQTVVQATDMWIDQQHNPCILILR